MPKLKSLTRGKVLDRSVKDRKRYTIDDLYKMVGGYFTVEQARDLLLFSDGDTVEKLKMIAGMFITDGDYREVCEEAYKVEPEVFSEIKSIQEAWLKGFLPYPVLEKLLQ